MRNGERDAELFDEIRLRRALRLDAAELPPRIDAVAIAAHAEANRPAFLAASLLSTVVAGLAGAAILALAAMAISAVAPSLASDFFAAGIQTLARVAVPAGALLALAAQPTVPVAALAALAVAIAYEYAQRRERLIEASS
jgi:hypothetical protein